MDIKHISDMVFLPGILVEDMNQNFKDEEKKIKVAVLAGQQAAINLGTCIILMKTLCTPILHFFTYITTKIHTTYIVLLQKQ